MTLTQYIEDHTGFLLTSFLFVLFQSLLLLFFKLHTAVICIFAALWLTLFSIYFLYTFYEKKKRYHKLLALCNQLDQKYLLHEVMQKHGSYEEKIYQQLLRMGNKSMLEKVSAIQRERVDYQEYVEQWVHEIKAPIVAMKLWAQNQDGQKKRDLLIQIERVEHYVEQALFYARSETIEKDFCIQPTDLNETLQESLLQSKYLCMEQHVHILLPEETYHVQSDAKWIIFILNQIIENAVKYRKIDCKSEISMYFIRCRHAVELHVCDNGIGISKRDLQRVFEKGFTGDNGRLINHHATGIGLFLCKKLCDALDIELTLTSQKGQGCDVCLRFLLTNL